jgi:hypothetical protein
VQPVCTPVAQVVQVPIIKTVKIGDRKVKVCVLETVTKIVWICR